jgi:hypothetical protein
LDSSRQLGTGYSHSLPECLNNGQTISSLLGAQTMLGPSTSSSICCRIRLRRHSMTSVQKQPNSKLTMKGSIDYVGQRQSVAIIVQRRTSHVAS